MKVCSVSDVHCSAYMPEPPDTPPADILTVSGDLTMRGNLDDLRVFRNWLIRQPSLRKVVIAGNHDFCFQNSYKHEARGLMTGDGIVYLQDSEAVVAGLFIYGAPWQPWWHDWAFNLQRGPEIRAKWNRIPQGLDILLVHGPPFGYGDRTLRGEQVGCTDLLAAIKLKKPKVVCYGHIHEDTGTWDLEGTKLINCSIGYRVGVADQASRAPALYEVNK